MVRVEASPGSQIAHPVPDSLLADSQTEYLSQGSPCYPPLLLMTSDPLGFAYFHSNSRGAAAMRRPPHLFHSVTLLLIFYLESEAHCCLSLCPTASETETKSDVVIKKTSSSASAAAAAARTQTSAHLGFSYLLSITQDCTTTPVFQSTARCSCSPSPAFIFLV